MGCPSGTCTGYELRARLDFDTDGDGSTYSGSGSTASSDSGDDCHNSGSGWLPIGNDSGSRFNTTFKGNGYVISQPAHQADDHERRRAVRRALPKRPRRVSRRGERLCLRADLRGNHRRRQLRRRRRVLERRTCSRARVHRRAGWLHHQRGRLPQRRNHRLLLHRVGARHSRRRNQRLGRRLDGEQPHTLQFQDNRQLLHRGGFFHSQRTRRRLGRAAVRHDGNGVLLGHHDKRHSGRFRLQHAGGQDDERAASAHRLRRRLRRMERERGRVGRRGRPLGFRLR